MKARLLLRTRVKISEEAFVEVVIWAVPKPVRGSKHDFKYSLALVEEGVCVVRYDNEAGKGDHKHVGERQLPYDFIGLDELQRDFWNDVEWWRKRL